MTEPERPSIGTSRPASPLRLLIVLIPVFVIVGVGYALISKWAGRIDLSEIRLDLPEFNTRPTTEEQPPSQTSERPAEAPDRRPQTAEEWLDWLTQPKSDAPPEPVIIPEPQPQAPPAFDVAAVIALLPTADPEEGAQRFRVCTVCHTAEAGAGHRVGPNLWNIVGRAKGKQDDFRYSRSLRDLGGTWTYADLAAYLHNPREFAPGTSMAFAGIKDPRKVADMLSYLRLLSERPGPLPK